MPAIRGLAWLSWFYGWLILWWSSCLWPRVIRLCILLPMELDAWERDLRGFYGKVDPSSLVIPVPSNSGVFNFPLCNPGDFQLGFTSRKDARWRLNDEMHFGDLIRTSSQELYGEETPAAEELVTLYTTSRGSDALNIHSFPEAFQRVMFEDKARDATRFLKSNLALKLFQEYFPNDSMYSIYAPSASGLALGNGGAIFVTDIHKADLNLIKTGTYTEMLKLYPGTMEL